MENVSWHWTQRFCWDGPFHLKNLRYWIYSQDVANLMKLFSSEEIHLVCVSHLSLGRRSSTGWSDSPKFCNYLWQNFKALVIFEVFVKFGTIWTLLNQINFVIGDFSLLHVLSKYWTNNLSGHTGCNVATMNDCLANSQEEKSFRKIPCNILNSAVPGLF